MSATCPPGYVPRANMGLPKHGHPAFLPFCPRIQNLARVRTNGGGGVAQSLGIRLFAFGGAYWPLATAHSGPLWVRTCFGCVNGAPG